VSRHIALLFAILALTACGPGISSKDSPDDPAPEDRETTEEPADDPEPDSDDPEPDPDEPPDDPVDPDTPSICGDGVVQPDETCDDGAENGMYGACNATCEGLSAHCGDGATQAEEACDGDDLAGASCESLGFDGGQLACDATCGLDTSGCAVCGDGEVGPGEQCDDGLDNGTYGHCSSDCSGPAAHCGDGIVNGPEECDGADLGTATCSSRGAGRGTLSCTSTCTIDEAACSRAPEAGEVIVTEIMQNPDVLYDNDGEWFEVHNLSGRTVDLDGCTVESSTSNGPESFQIVGSSAIAPGGYFTLARSSDPKFLTDYVYGTAMNLNNYVDYVALICADPFTDEATTIDEVAYDDGATFPDPTGASMSLSPDAYSPSDNDLGANWCESTSPFGLGDLGTPGQPNDSC
jgi:hypothetical protein